MKFFNVLPDLLAATLLLVVARADITLAQTRQAVPQLPETTTDTLGKAPEKLTDVLADKRPSHILTDEELLNRLYLLEVLIDAEGVAKSIKLIAISMRDFDRAERDRRRAINMKPDKFPIAVLADTRPSVEMSKKELELRLEKIRDQLARPGIPLIARDELKEKQTSDTRALRQRLDGIKPQKPAQ